MDRTERHPLFGEIPLIEVKVTGLRGEDRSWWRYDPDYEPRAKELLQHVQEGTAK